MFFDDAVEYYKENYLIVHTIISFILIIIGAILIGVDVTSVGYGFLILGIVIIISSLVYHQLDRHGSLPSFNTSSSTYNPGDDLRAKANKESAHRRYLEERERNK